MTIPTTIYPDAPDYRKRFRLAGAVFLLAVLLTVWMSISAYRSFGKAFPSLLVDPYGVFSKVYLTSWNTQSYGITHDYKVTAVNDREIGDTTNYGNFPTDRYFEIIRELFNKNITSAKLTFVDIKGNILRHECAIRTLGFPEVRVYFVFYALMGWFTLWVGLIIWVYAPENESVRAFATLCVFTLVFNLSYFDYHTNAWAVPFFSVSWVGISASLIWLAYTFPSAPRNLPHWFKYLFRALAIVALLAALVLVLGPVFNMNTRWLRITMDKVGRVALLSLALSVVIRLILSKGVVRRQLFSTLIGLAFVLVIMAFLMVSEQIFPWGGPLLFAVFPLFPLLATLTVVYSLIRYDILDTGIVINRWMFIVPLILLSLSAGFLVFSVADIVGKDWEALFEILIFIGLASCLLVFYIGLKSINRFLFPAASQFRPTIEILTEKLSTLRNPGEIRDELVNLVARWLPTTGVSVLDEPRLRSDLALSQAKMKQLYNGKALWIEHPPGKRMLIQPMKSSDVLQGGLMVSPKVNNALYTEEDLSLLATIAGLGAISLHNAGMLNKLEEVRQLEAHTIQRDKQLAINVLGAEMAHEINYPLNYFRMLLEELRKTGKADPGDVDIGYEELKRLERMLSTLRKLQYAAPKLDRTEVLSHLQRAVTLLQNIIDEKNIRISLDVSDKLAIKADADPLLQLFSNLLRNAFQSIDVSGNVQVRFKKGAEYAAIEIRDDGPGVPREVQDAIFNPLVTTRKEGVGLGLTICQRIVRSFGWTIYTTRENNMTCFSIQFPVSDILNE